MEHLVPFTGGNLRARDVEVGTCKSRPIRALLRVAQSPETTFQASDALLEFHRDDA